MRIDSSQIIPPETERSSFRFLTLEDAEKWKDFVLSEKAMKFFNFPMVESESLAWIERQLKRYEDNLGGLLAVIEKESGNLVGQCGLLLQEVDDKKVLEVGYSFLPKYWGKGFATESASAFYSHGLKLKLSSFIVSLIHEDNIRSQRVVEKNGLHIWKTTVWKDMPVQVWKIENL